MGINFTKNASIVTRILCFQKHQPWLVLCKIWTLLLPREKSFLQGEW